MNSGEAGCLPLATTPFVRYLYAIHVFVVPVLIGVILLVRGREPLANDTQLWWIPAIHAQQSLLAFAFAFGSTTFARRSALLMLGCCYVVVIYLLTSTVLYESSPQFDGPLSEQLIKASTSLLPTLVFCSLTLWPFRLFFGVASKSTSDDPRDRLRILDLLLSTLIVAVAIATYQIYVSSFVGMDFEQFKAMPQRIFLYSLHSACLLGLFLAVLSRRHRATGITLFLSAITLHLAFYATLLPFYSGLSTSAYHWGVVAVTLIALRLAGYRIGTRWPV